LPQITTETLLITNPTQYGWQRVNEVTYKVKQAAAAAEAEGQQRKKK
jgi:hypothetical protein